MTTVVPPSAPALPQPGHLKTGSLASSSKIAISSANITNYLSVYGTGNIMFLSLDESPLSSANASTANTGSGVISKVVETTAQNYQDAFIVGKRLSSAGNVTFMDGFDSPTYHENNGSVNEGLTITRGFQYGTAGIVNSVLWNTSYSINMISVITHPNQYLTTGNLTTPSRSSSQPIVSCFEDDAIGTASDGGCMSDVVDHIKRAWQQHIRCLFSVRKHFSTTTTAYTNLIDHIVGTNGFEIECKGRQLYTTDTTATVHVTMSGNGLTVSLSSSKESFSTSLAGLVHTTLLIDCVSDDAITVKFKGGGTTADYFHSMAIMEWYTTAVE